MVLSLGVERSPLTLEKRYIHHGREEMATQRVRKQRQWCYFSFSLDFILYCWEGISLCCAGWPKTRISHSALASQVLEVWVLSHHAKFSQAVLECIVLGQDGSREEGHLTEMRASRVDGVPGRGESWREDFRHQCAVAYLGLTSILSPLWTCLLLSCGFPKLLRLEQGSVYLPSTTGLQLIWGQLWVVDGQILRAERMSRLLWQLPPTLRFLGMWSFFSLKENLISSHHCSPAVGSSSSRMWGSISWEWFTNREVCWASQREWWSE